MAGAGWPKGKPHSPETKQKIALAMHGRTLSEKTIKRISLGLRRHYSKRKPSAAEQEQAAS